MRFRCSAALLVQVSQPTANRAVRDFEAPGDLRLALLASLARAQHPLTQVCRIRAPHDRSSLQGITLPPSTERRLDQPVLPLANRSSVLFRTLGPSAPGWSRPGRAQLRVMLDTSSRIRREVLLP